MDRKNETTDINDIMPKTLDSAKFILAISNKLPAEFFKNGKEAYRLLLSMQYIELVYTNRTHMDNKSAIKFLKDIQIGDKIYKEHIAMTPYALQEILSCEVSKYN